jgi:hypothetical protein
MNGTGQIVVIGEGQDRPDGRRMPFQVVHKLEVFPHLCCPNSCSAYIRPGSAHGATHESQEPEMMVPSADACNAHTFWVWPTRARSGSALPEARL